MLRQRPTDDSIKLYAVEYMRTKTRSFAYTRNVLVRLQQQARGEIERLGGNAALLVILEALVVQPEVGDEQVPI